MASEHADAFPSTRWSRIVAEDGSARDLDALARTYWRPIRAYLAARERCRPEDAEDLAQEAFAWLLEKRLFERAEPARGRFRGFLKTALGNFAIERHRHAAAQKRGGDRAHGPLDLASGVPANSPSPEQALDDAWRRELLEGADRMLRAELEQNGRAVHYRLFREWFLEDGEQADHRALAERHGISRTDVSNWLDYGKRRYRAILRGMVSDTVGDPDELQAELNWLFGDGPKARQ